MRTYEISKVNGVYKWGLSPTIITPKVEDIIIKWSPLAPK